MYDNNPNVNTAFIILTEQCNLRCKYCYETHGSKRISEEVLKEGIDFVFRDSKDEGSTVNITLFGGEPTLEADLIETAFITILELKKKYNRNVSTGIITNCTIMTDKLYDILDKYMKDVNLSVQLSVDGTKETQDENRIFANGKGSFDTVIPVMYKWIELFEKNQMKSLSVHGCITTKTVHNLYENFLYYRTVMEIERLWYLPVSEDCWTDGTIAMYKEQMGKIYEWILNSGNIRAEIENFAPFDKCLGSWDKRGKPCGAGGSFVSIATNGDLYACHQLYFNAKESKIGDIWSGVDNDKRRIFTEYSDDDFKCSSEYNCEQIFCYRCIASNYDNKGYMMGQNYGNHCSLMKIDFGYQKKLKDFRGKCNATK